MPYATTRDGCRLYYKDWGSGRPVVLIHGWPLSADSWDDVALAIADAGMRAIFYDRRGFGRSEQPWDGYNYDCLSDDLADVMTAAGATENVALVGFSMGGGEVARYLSRHAGQGVVQVALVASVVPCLLKSDDNPEGASAEVFEAIKDGIRKDRADFFGSFFADFFGMGLMAQPVSDGALDWAWRLAMQAGLKPTLDCVDAFGLTDFRPDLAAFTMPTLIVHGTADKTVPIDATARAAAAAIPHAQLIEYDGAPHGLFASHKERLIADLLAFLREGGADRSFMLREEEAPSREPDASLREPLGQPQADFGQR